MGESGYSEPFFVKRGVTLAMVFDCDGNPICEVPRETRIVSDGDHIYRMVDCTNALSGIANPAAVKDVIEAARLCHASLWGNLQRLEDGASEAEVEQAAHELRLQYEALQLRLTALDKEPER